MCLSTLQHEDWRKKKYVLGFELFTTFNCCLAENTPTFESYVCHNQASILTALTVVIIQIKKI